MMKFTIISRGLSTSTKVNNGIKQIAVIGGGLMGSGITQVAAQVGQKVTLVDINSDVLDKAHLSITNNLGRVAKKLFKDNPADAQNFVKNALENIHLSCDPVAATKNVDLIVEAIVENLEAKQNFFSSIESTASEHTIFATNTSSLSVQEIGSVVKRKDRFGGLHFFNPVPVMKLLEVVKAPETSQETFELMMEWGLAIGKTCITCKDTPGFIVNRLLIPYSSEAVHMLDRGDATAADIDLGMKLGCGYPMGPLELADYVGLDTNKFIQEAWHKKFPDHPSYKPTKVLDKLVAEGKLGIKSGEGFFKYNRTK